jgi:hypothetical protein
MRLPPGQMKMANKAKVARKKRPTFLKGLQWQLIHLQQHPQQVQPQEQEEELIKPPLQDTKAQVHYMRHQKNV